MDGVTEETSTQVLMGKKVFAMLLVLTCFDSFVVCKYKVAAFA